MPNCAIYVIPTRFIGGGNRFNLSNGNYSFALDYETSDANGSNGTAFTPEIAWASSNQTIDNAIMDAVIAHALANFNVTITRNDCVVFR